MDILVVDTPYVIIEVSKVATFQPVMLAISATLEGQYMHESAGHTVRVSMRCERSFETINGIVSARILNSQAFSVEVVIGK